MMNVELALVQWGHHNRVGGALWECVQAALSIACYGWDPRLGSTGELCSGPVFHSFWGWQKELWSGGHACWCRTESHFIFCEGGLCLLLMWQIPRHTFLCSQRPGWLIGTALASPYCWPKHLAPLRMRIHILFSIAPDVWVTTDFLRSKVKIHLELKKKTPHNLQRQAKPFKTKLFNYLVYLKGVSKLSHF